jgi:glycine cleavage system H protein
MNIPKDLLYSKSHEWVKILENQNARIGITDHAQHKLSDIVFVNLSGEGEKVSAHTNIGDVESIKAVSEVYSPLGGQIIKVNREVLDNPSLINGSPYEAWLVELSGVSGKENLLSPEDYEKLVKAES